MARADVRRGTLVSRPVGRVAWLTGLPGAGKTTLANLLGERLAAERIAVTIIDGDAFRRQSIAPLGYSAEDRARNVERMARAAAVAACCGNVVLVAAIAPFTELRRKARAIVEEFAPFIEVYVEAPLAVCIERDPKGHYRRALRGELPNFTGISDPYEPPTEPDVRVDTASLTPEEAAELIEMRLSAPVARRASKAHTGFEPVPPP